MIEPRMTLADAAADLAAGRTSSRQLVSDCLARISAAQGEGSRTFLKVFEKAAVASAEFHDQLRQLGSPLSPYAGIPLSSKDLFDLGGDVTRAASVVLADAPPAARDAVCIARLKAAGFIIIGRTNMTEFAFSGIGMNPHYGTPRNPWDRAAGRIPGGSSSGAAISVTDGMCLGAIGTDTGGSCRIPAALCGIVGFKPTARRVPTDGTYPLSTSLDSIGPLAPSVGCCEVLDAVLAGKLPAASPHPSHTPELSSLRLAILGSYVTDNMDATVSQTYGTTLQQLAAGGANLMEIALPELAELADVNRMGGISAAEAFALHRQRLDSEGARYDPRVAARILRGKEQSAADYIDLLNKRASFVARVSAKLEAFDAVLMPTTPVVAPTIAELEADGAYWRFNALMLRNPSIVNFLDGCAISLPCHEPDSAPVGLSLFGVHDSDRRLFAAAAAVEHRLAVAAGTL